MAEELRTPADQLFVFRELDAVNRRIDGLDTRVSNLDTHGSRGLSGLQVQLTEFAKDLARVEVELRRTRANRWQSIMAVIAALIPIYLFVIQQFLSSR